MDNFQQTSGMILYVTGLLWSLVRPRGPRAKGGRPFKSYSNSREVMRSVQILGVF